VQLGHNKSPVVHVVCVENDANGISQTPIAKAFFDARIDIRKLAQFLSCQQFSPNKVICSEHFCYISLKLFAVNITNCYIYFFTISSVFH